jgi:hypothetical protein
MNAKLLGALVLVAIPLAAQQPSPRELFERARILEESNRSLDEAAAMYRQVASQSLERELAAAALVRMGLLYERLGRVAEAQRVFRMVVDRYADQIELVHQARLRLSASPRPDDAPTARRMWAAPDVDLSGGPSPDGRRLSYVDWQTGDLAVRDLVTGTSRRLTRNLSDQQQRAFPFASAFSPDGREVAYGWMFGSYTDLRIVRADGGGSPRTLVHSEDMSIRQLVRRRRSRSRPMAGISSTTFLRVRTRLIAICTFLRPTAPARRRSSSTMGTICFRCGRRTAGMSCS